MDALLRISSSGSSLYRLVCCLACCDCSCQLILLPRDVFLIIKSLTLETISRYQSDDNAIRKTFLHNFTANCDTSADAVANMARKNMKKEMQEIMNSADCEEMDPSSESVHSGNPPMFRRPAGALASGRTTPPNSLAIMPDHIFGTNVVGRDSVAFRTSSSVDNGGQEDCLESPSKVLGGSTSWTGGLSHGCTAVFRNNETATTAVSLGSPMGPNGSTPRSLSANRLEYLKNWTISTYKCSRQSIFEKMGKSSRTVDTELECQIESLRDTQRKYSNILRLARALTSHFFHVVQTQSALGEAFGDLGNRSPELLEEFICNSDTQKSLVKNGEQLIAALNFFVSSVNTLCNKTMDDTIQTVKHYEAARVEYDAYRADLEYYASAPKTEINQAKQQETLEIFEKQKQEFEKLRSDVQIKLKFLDENRVKVMHKQLLLFHNAISAYFSGNQKALEATIRQFSINLKSPNSTTPSWVEK